MMTIFLMILAIIVGSVISLLGGIALLQFKKRRQAALLLTMPFGAGALLAAAFFDLMPESFERASPRTMLLYCLAGFIFFFILERSASWFHHHHEHENHQDAQQRRLIVFGDLMHNAIDGVAVAAAFLVSPATGIITTLAVSAHEIPKELGTFALLLSKGWKDKMVVFANVATAFATVIAAILVYSLGKNLSGFEAPMLALTSGFFIYVAASDIIPDIHEQPQKIGTIQAAMLVAGVIIVGCVITLLGV